MSVLLLVLTLQGAGWTAAPSAVTVGDTVRLEHRLLVPAAVEARLAPLAATDVVAPLQPPRWWYAEGTLTVQYAVALFATGRQPVVVPEVELLYPDGRVETLAADTAWVTVRSVLPAGPLPDPAPSAAPIARRPKRTGPLIALVSGVTLVAVLWGWLRRRTAPRVPRAAPPAEPTEPPVDRWMGAGESRAVAAATADRLRRHIARRFPNAGRHLDTEGVIAVLAHEGGDLRLRELSQLLRALERASFAPAVPTDVVETVTRTEELMQEMEEIGEVGQVGETRQVGEAEEEERP
ncbi:MAG: hypothetical protein PVF27_04950 [Gemmatimonadales bacterium]|jgi:hypothetical protein